MNDTIGSKLSALRRRAELSLAEVAAACGFAGPSSIQKYFKDDYDRPLRGTTALRFAQVFTGKGEPPIDAQDVMELTELASYREIADANDRVLATRDVWLTHNVAADQGRARSLAALQGQDEDVPTYATDAGDLLQFPAIDGMVEVETTLLDFDEITTPIRRPHGISKHQTVFVIFVPGSSMSPRYKPGEPIFVDPRRPPGIGDDVVVLLNPNEVVLAAREQRKPKPATVLIKGLVARTNEGLVLEQHSPASQFSVPFSEIGRIYRVIPWAECLGI